MPIKLYVFDPVELRELYIGRDMSSEEMAAHYQCSGQTVLNHLHKHGIPLKPQKNRPGRPQPNKARKLGKNGFWKGGRSIDKHGYVLLKWDDHPAANRHGYVRLHRLVMEEKLGRPLLAKEVVHHKDGNVANNDPENLELFSSNTEHLAATLRRKCPAWSEAGYQRMLQNGQLIARRNAAIHRELAACAREHSKTPAQFLAGLAKEDQRLLRMAVELCRLAPLEQLRQERETLQRDWLVLQSPRSRRLWGRRFGYQT